MKEIEEFFVTTISRPGGQQLTRCATACWAQQPGGDAMLYRETPRGQAQGFTIEVHSTGVLDQGVRDDNRNRNFRWYGHSPLAPQ
jgi:hypothetical protein